ncbi:MAG: NACHT domain-containing protein [Sulfuricaulis sp.]
MNTSDPASEVIVKVAADLIVDIVKSGYKGLQLSKKWITEKNKEHDFLGNASRQYAERLEQKCNVMHIFGMTKPIPLSSIRVQVKLQNKLTAHQRVSAEDLQSSFDHEQKNFSATLDTRLGIEAVNEYSRLVVLGKPGAGKTTFLKIIALEALSGHLIHRSLPIFITIKDWVDSKLTLLEYITEQFELCGFPDAKPFILRILDLGKCIVLFDGYDEITGEEENVKRQIKNLSAKFSKSQYVLSCRLAAYDELYETYHIVEVADFNDEQIKSFIANWFRAEQEKGELCWATLDHEENRSIKELARTPLLLAMLCLLFQETMSFPSNRAELYKEATDALLKKWDASRGIKRDQIYKNLSSRKKEDMLSLIAKNTFVKKQYFFTRRVAESIIEDYVANLASLDEVSDDLDGETILKSIEAQHGLLVERAAGVYSFSHLTLQEYFTARFIAYDAQGKKIETYIDLYLLDKGWREVFLLAISMLLDADDAIMLMRKKVSDIAQKTKMIKLLM